VGSGGCNPSRDTITNSPSFTSTVIYGDVRANNQVSGGFMTSNGLVASSGVSAIPLPFLPHDRNAQKAAATATMTAAAAGCDGIAGATTRTWPANLHITGPGEVFINNNCTILVEGDVWIDARLGVNNYSIMKPASGVTTPPTIMVDGDSSPYFNVQDRLTFNNHAKSLLNSSGVGLRYINYFTTAACGPDCTTLSDSEIFDNLRYDRVFINNSSDTRGAIIDNRWGSVFSNNNSNIGSISGIAVEFFNGAILGGYISGGVGDWTIKLYKGVTN
jgi:hypothetical protein